MIELIPIIMFIAYGFFGWRYLRASTQSSNPKTDPNVRRALIQFQLAVVITAVVILVIWLVFYR